MPLRRALSAPLLCLLTSLVLVGGALAKGEEPIAAVSIVPGSPDQPTLVEIEITAGGGPFEFDPLTTIFVRAVHRTSGEVVEATASASDVTGAYAASLDLPQPGSWRIAVGGRYGGDTWLLRSSSGAEWNMLALPEVAAGAADASEATSASGSMAISPVMGLAAVLATALLIGIGVVGSLRRQSAATSG